MNFFGAIPMRYLIHWHGLLWGMMIVPGILARPVPAQSADPKWDLLDGDCQVRLLQHVRTSEPASDDLRFIAGHGTETYAYCQIPQALVIPELKVEVPLCADRSGLQVKARVVLPRAINPATDGPYTLLVAGESYQKKTHWQSLVLDDIAQKMERGLRLLQLQTAHPIDAREAYIDMLLVNIYGGPGKTHVQLGDATLDGAAATAPSIGLATWSAVPTRSAPVTPSPIRLCGDVLLIKGQPFLARMIDDNGEDWKLLVELGVNTIRLATPASVEQMARAESWGLWIVCPPPTGVISADSAVHWRRVLAWDLSQQIFPADPQQALPLSQALRGRDRLQIPILCDNSIQPRMLSRAADILLHHRGTLGTDFSFGEYADWVAQRVDQAHPGTVHWMGVDTQPGANLRQQILAFGCPQSGVGEIDQVQLLARLACMRSIRGVYFRSETLLDPSTTEGRKRTLAIRLANIDLDILQPWLSVGQTTPIPLPAAAPAGVRAWQSVCGRATLVSVVSTSTTAQYCPDPAADAVSLVLPGVTDVHNVLLLSTAGMVPLAKKQIAGGVEVSVPLIGNTALLLVTRDATIVRELADKLNRTSHNLMQLTAQRIDLELAEEQLQSGTIISDVARAPTQNTLRDEFQRALGQQNYVECHDIGGQLLAGLAQRRFENWIARSRQYDSPAACPLATQPGTRRWLEQFQGQNSSAITMLNLLPAGDCEAIEQLRSAGWQLMVAEPRRENTSASFVTDEKRSGRGCLRLQADTCGRQDDTDGRPWIWANTPPTTIPAGQIFRMDGWMKYENQTETTGLLVFDSLAGPGCGLRIAASGAWKPFTLYRATEIDAPVTLTVALTGPGRVWVDDLTISLVQSIDTLRADVLASDQRYARERR